MYIDELVRYTEADELSNTLERNNAVWHNVCRNRHDKQKVERAFKEHSKRQSSVDTNPSPVKTRRSSDFKDDNNNIANDTGIKPCLICNETGEIRWGGCHRAATLGIHEKVWAAAEILRDTELLAKLSAGDMVAIDAVYHLRCLNCLYKKADALRDGNNRYDDKEKLQQQQAFVELQEYIESFRGSSEVISMSDVCHIYEQRLEELGNATKTHTTRLRKSLVEAIPDLECVQNKSGQWDLIFDENLAAAVYELKRQDTVNDKVIAFSRAANILRQAIFKSRNEYNSSNSVSNTPDEIKVFLSFVMNGSQVKRHKDQVIKATEKVVNTIGQLISFNTVAKRKGKKEQLRHSRKSETPFALYIGIKTYLTSGLDLLNQLHAAGLSVSQDRVKNLATDIANSCIAKWKAEEIVIPPHAKQGAFTCLGFDNVDWNARNPMAQLLSTLHGTIFIVHQFDESDEPYAFIEILSEEQGKRVVAELPESYTTVDYNYNLQASDQYIIPNQNSEAQEILNLGLEDPLLEDTLLEPQNQWLSDCRISVIKDELDPDEYVSWGAYYASKTHAPTQAPMQSYPQPIFLEKANDPAMVAHILSLSMAVTEQLNPGQTTWIETDQPLYYLTKRIQQKYPDEFGEGKLLVTMGSLHTEKMLWTASGEFVNGSGYTSALTSSGLCSSGVEESVISVSSILRTRYIKQVFVAAIDILKQRAYLAYRENEDRRRAEAEGTSQVQSPEEITEDESDTSQENAQTKTAREEISVNTPTVEENMMIQNTVEGQDTVEDQDRVQGANGTGNKAYIAVKLVWYILLPSLGHIIPICGIYIGRFLTVKCCRWVMGLHIHFMTHLHLHASH